MARRIFVVEDHPVMRTAYAAALARETDIELCGTAESAEKALEAIRPDRCDLVLIDVALPGISGIELVRRLRAAYPALPLIVITGHDGRMLAREATSAGAIAYLSKKDLPSSLVRTIRETLGGTEQRASV